ncbi:MAG TPA: F0F1 ATP synthase subunit B [Candidatus Nanoarchaeia archaeon]|nr:ATP synthase subunit b, sodium ion specific [uncultured archaeon]
MKIIEEFGINPYLLLAQVVNFTILLFLLKKILYKPILKVLEERKVKIVRSLKEAEDIEKRLVETAKEQEKILEKARSEAANLISEVKKESKELSEKMLADTRATVDEAMKRGEERLELEKQQMMSEVKKDLAGLVIAATAKVTQKTMDEPSNRRLVEEVVREMSKS